MGSNRIIKVQGGCGGGVKQKQLIESFEDGGVRFQGTITRPDGTACLDRTTLRPLPVRMVSQHIQLSTDGGNSWKEVWLWIHYR